MKKLFVKILLWWGFFVIAIFLLGEIAIRHLDSFYSIQQMSIHPVLTYEQYTYLLNVCRSIRAVVLIVVTFVYSWGLFLIKKN